jgi:ABC-type Fe3+-hydroxamate transport system substrate-binding protein
MKNAFFILLMFFSLGLIAQNNTTTFYVLASSGLNLRKSADANAEKITLLPKGAKVTLLTPAAAKNMTVDNLKGGMAKVKYGDQTGFVFDGYLSAYPWPADLQRDEDDRTKTYVDQVRDLGKEATLETHEWDHGGYFRSEKGIHLFTNNWQEVFLLAKAMHNIQNHRHQSRQP